MCFCVVLGMSPKLNPPLFLSQDSRSVFWRPCVFVGRWVCVSALRASSLRGWAGHRVLSVTSQSRLVARSLAHNQPGTAATEETETETERSQRLSQQESLARVQRLRADEQASGADEPTSGADAEADAVPREEPPAGPSAGPGAACAVKIKRSKIISYKVRGIEGMGEGYRERRPWAWSHGLSYTSKMCQHLRCL